MVRRAFLALLATTPLMVAARSRIAPSPPLEGLAGPPPQTLSTCDMFLDPSRDFFDTHTWLAAGMPVNLTGCSASMVIGHPSDRRPLIHLSNARTSEGRLVLGGIAGTIEVHIMKAAMTSLVGIRQASYALVVRFAEGTMVSLLQGEVYLDQLGRC